jgi:hypothetical protein
LWVHDSGSGESKVNDTRAAPEHVYLCYRTSTDPVEVTARGINAVAVLQSTGEYAMDPALAAFDRMQVSDNLELCFQLQSATAMHEDEDFGDDAGEDENDDGWGEGGKDRWSF